MIYPLWKWLDAYPPILVRLLARTHHSHALSTQEISDRSGLTPYQVTMLGQSLSWDGIDIRFIKAFMQGCNVDFCDTKRMKLQRLYLKHPTWQHLRVSDDWNTLYQPLMIRYRAYMKAMLKR